LRNDFDDGAVHALQQPRTSRPLVLGAEHSDRYLG
jgi:hypothetical protein